LTDHVVGGLFEEVTRSIICPFFNVEVEEKPVEQDLDGWRRGHLELVKEIELRGKW
jgi:hypothetical protein